MKLLALAQEASYLYYDLNEVKTLTRPDSDESRWLASLRDGIASLPSGSIHKKQMLCALDKLHHVRSLAFEQASQTMDLHPHLVQRYGANNFESLYLHREDIVEFSIPVRIANIEYSLKINADHGLESSQYEDLTSSQRIQLLTDNLLKGYLTYAMEIECKQDNATKTIAYFGNRSKSMVGNDNQQKAQFQGLDSTLVDNLANLLEVDTEIMEHGLKHPHIIAYRQQRELISQILMRCPDEHLFIQAGKQSIMAFQTIMTQENVLGMKSVMPTDFSKMTKISLNQ